MQHIRKEFVRKYSRKTQDTINPLIHESVNKSKLQQQKNAHKSCILYSYMEDCPECNSQPDASENEPSSRTSII